MNQLAQEGSPYLQQHASNPVDWYPWGEEAFEQARREEKPIFLSIGYSTCHWCHVMAHESFEDEETAALMNRLFVNIKVDREERPDIDALYMTALQALTGHGGWPLSAWLTPDLKPYYLGTYFPPRPLHGRPSFRQALLQLSEAWEQEREKVNRSADAILEAVRRGSDLAREGSGPDLVDQSGQISQSPVVSLFRSVSSTFDQQNGGFGRAPKFPRPVLLDFLLAYSHVHSDSTALSMVQMTLEKMSTGGIYDHLGGGFARYSVDAEWIVPHFEKMLYDQAQLLATMSDFIRESGDRALEPVVRQTIEYLERDLKSPEGGYYSAEDADSEGQEGLFYVWRYEELATILTEDQLSLAREYYQIDPAGNFEDGMIILVRNTSDAKINFETTEKLTELNRILFDVRSERVRPSRDEKIITAWNGLLIGGLAKAGAALGDATLLRRSSELADWLLGSMQVEGRLMRRSIGGDVRIDAFLDDYAFLATGLLELYLVEWETRWLDDAIALVERAIELFHDKVGGGFFLSSSQDENLPVRTKADHDGAEPSGNSAMVLLLLRLGRLLGRTDFVNLAEETIRAFMPRLHQYPEMLPGMITGLIGLSSPQKTIALITDVNNPKSRELAHELRSAYAPFCATLLVDRERDASDTPNYFPYLDELIRSSNQTALILCTDYTCTLPILDPDVEAIRSALH